MTDLPTVPDLRNTVGRVLGTTPDRDWPDSALIAACLDGDQRAWEALVLKYKQLVYAIPFRYGAQADDAADIFQAVWIDLHNELPRLRNTEALRSWLMTVAGRHSLRWKRRNQRRGETALLDNSQNEWEEEKPLPHEVIEQLQLQQSVREAIAALPERCRAMVEMLFLKDPPVPYQEVASHFGLALGSIGFIRGRCLDKLRKELEARQATSGASR